MRTSIVLVTLVCLFGLGLAQDDNMQGAMDKCTSDYGSKMQEIMQDMMSGNMDGFKDKMCKITKDMAKCILKQAYKERPSDADISTLQKKVDESASQGGEGVPKFDCDINVKTLADEAYGSGALANTRPWPVLALAVASLAAIFLSKFL